MWGRSCQGREISGRRREPQYTWILGYKWESLVTEALLVNCHTVWTTTYLNITKSKTSRNNGMHHLISNLYPPHKLSETAVPWVITCGYMRRICSVASLTSPLVVSTDVLFYWLHWYL